MKGPNLRINAFYKGDFKRGLKQGEKGFRVFSKRSSLREKDANY